MKLLIFITLSILLVIIFRILYTYSVKRAQYLVKIESGIDHIDLNPKDEIDDEFLKSKGRAFVNKIVEEKT